MYFPDECTSGRGGVVVSRLRAGRRCTEAQKPFPELLEFHLHAQTKTGGPRFLAPDDAQKRKNRFQSCSSSTCTHRPRQVDLASLHRTYCTDDRTRRDCTQLDSTPKWGCTFSCLRTIRWSPPRKTSTTGLLVRVLRRSSGWYTYFVGRVEARQRASSWELSGS